VRLVIISGLAAILTGCATPQVHQASPRILREHRVAKTEKAIAESKSNPRHRSTTNRHTVNAAPFDVPKTDISSRVQPKNNSDTVRNIILKSLEKRQTMVNAIAILGISVPPLCTKQLPPDTVEKAGVMALVYGFHVEDEDFQREVRDAGINRAQYMSKDGAVRESTCAWAQVLGVLAHDMYKGADEYKRRVGETAATR
jgi:hypothetical protein